MKTNISNTPAGQRLLLNLERRIRVANQSEQTIRNYVRSLGVKTNNYHHDSVSKRLKLHRKAADLIPQ